MAVLKKFRRHFLTHLHCVTPVNEDGSFLRCKQHKASRTGKPGQPAQALIMGGNVLSQVFVSPRYDKGIAASGKHLPTHGRKALRDHIHHDIHSINEKASVPEVLCQARRHRAVGLALEFPR